MGGRCLAVHGLRSGRVRPRHCLAAGHPAEVAAEEVPGGVPVLPGVWDLRGHPRQDQGGDCGKRGACRFQLEEH